MTKSLLTFTFSLFTIFFMSAPNVYGQQSDKLEAEILSGKKELVLAVVDVDGFAAQDDLNSHYKSRYYSNVEWLKQHWHQFIKSVREGKSFRVELNAEAYQQLSESEKSKIKALFNTCYTKTFDPIGIANVQIASIEYNPKHDKDNEQSYDKKQLTDEAIEAYVQHKRTAVLVLNANTAAQISSILKK